MRHRLSSLMTLLLVFGASGCGSEPTITPPIDDETETFTVGGSIAGSTGDVTLSLNATSETFATSAFTFTQQLPAGAAYAVLFAASSTGQECTVGNGIGVITANVDNVTVGCDDVDPELRYVDAEITGNIGIGDLDGDGTPDVVMTIRTLPGHAIAANLDMYRIAFGEGAGAFSAPIDVARIGSSDSNERGRHFVIADFDGDGTDDFAYSSGSGLEVFSIGATRTPTRFFAPSVSGQTGEPLIGFDADGNGTTDLSSIVWGGSVLDYFNLFRSNGDGSFSAQEFIGNRDDAEAQALGLGAPVNMTSGDFDGDGHEDLLSVNLVGPGSDLSLALALLSGDGAGGFSYPANLSPVSDDVFEGFFAFEIASKEIAPGDIDGDGDLDVVMTSTTNFILILENNGSGVFTEVGRAPVRLRPIHTRLADFNGDGILDLLSAHADSRDVTIAFGAGDGSFGASAGGESEWRVLTIDQDADLIDVFVADMDGDGTLDVVVAENGTNPSDSGRGSVQVFLAPGL